MVRARLGGLAIVRNVVEPGIASITADPGRLLEIEGTRAHTNGQPCTNPAALWIEGLGGAPGFEEDVVEQVLGLTTLADDP